MHKQQRSKVASDAAGRQRKGPGKKSPGRNGQPVESFVPQTDLGRRLWGIRRKIVATGQHLLNWDAIERELHERPGDASREA